MGIELYMLRNFKHLYYKWLKLIKKDVRLKADIHRLNLLPILNFHQISPHQNPFWSPMPPELFEDLLIFIKENFHVISLKDLPNVKSDKPSVIISFDDGYYDFVEYALPILEKHDLTANQNIIPTCVESGLPTYNVQLYDFLKAVTPKVINEIRLPGFDVKLNGNGIESKIQFGLQISAFLKNRSRSERSELWEIIRTYLEKVEHQKTRMMSLEDIKEIAKKVEIGAHSFSHETMGFEDNDFFTEDLNKCFSFFQSELNLPLEIYAFPNGSYRTEQVEILQSRKLKHILLVNEKYSQIEATVHPRFTIYGVTKLELMFQALGLNNK